MNFPPLVQTIYHRVFDDKTCYCHNIVMLLWQQPHNIYAIDSVPNFVAKQIEYVSTRNSATDEGGAYRKWFYRASF